MPRAKKPTSKPTLVSRRDVGLAGAARTSKHSPTVEDYINAAPKKVQRRLHEFRAVIRRTVPTASESISYQMPFYNYKGKLAWFALAPSKSYIGLYMRPPVIEQHKDELAQYVTTKSAIHFPLAEEMPAALVRKLIRARMRMNEAEE